MHALPATPLGDVADSHLCHTVLLGEGPQGNPARSLPSNVPDGVLGEPSALVAPSPLDGHVLGVVGHCANKQMGGSNASWGVAFVEYGHSWRNLSAGEFPTYAVCLPHSGAATPTAYLPVASASKAGSPKPTAIGGDIDFAPKPLGKRASHYDDFTGLDG